MDLKYLYGTAWKEEITADCVFNAISAGYRAIDTANQRKHYNEPGVGDGLSQAYSELDLKRDDLFLQTKFTYASSQDHRKPYNENDPLKTQVRSSFESSLKNLTTDTIDSFILHGPTSTKGITDEDKEVWIEMEALFKEGVVQHLGVSNVTASQLREFYEFATIKPKFAQIRCFANSGWEQEHRIFCNEKGITFQGFSLLTANRDYLGGSFHELKGRNVPQLQLDENQHVTTAIGKIMDETNKSLAQVVFKFCHQIGILPIVGTRSVENMKLNLDINDFELSEVQMQTIENIAR